MSSDHELRKQIDELVEEAYKLGRMHERNAVHVAKGEPPVRAGEGWSVMAARIWALVTAATRSRG